MTRSKQPLESIKAQIFDPVYFSLSPAVNLADFPQGLLQIDAHASLVLRTRKVVSRIKFQ